MAHLKEINTTKNSWESVSEKVIAVGHTTICRCLNLQKN